MMMLTFTCYKRSTLSFIALIENAGITRKSGEKIFQFLLNFLFLKVVAFRELLYVMIVRKFHSAYKVQFDKMFNDR